jgi:ATP-dependent protease HslVU (ClpYQ) peptidase subunit
MTCIVGYIKDNNVWIGGDSAGVSNYSLSIRSDEKVFKKGEFIFGFTSSFRMGQLIRYKLNIPIIKEQQDIDDYLYTDFIDSIIQCFKTNHCAKTENNEISCGSFLFGFRGKLYAVHSDFQIAKPFLNFDAVGCGDHIALGAMYSIEYTNPSMPPSDKITLALEAAENYSAGVRRPFNIVSLK